MVRTAPAARLRLLSEHQLTWLDVFTARPLSGNQLAVVHDADGVGDDTMLAFARETRLSETTFVQSPAAEGADYRNRIWMVRGEVPFAGHPSLGTAAAVAFAQGQERASYVQQTRAGLQRCDVERTGPRTARATMLQEPATFGPELDPDRVFAAIGVARAFADPRLPPQNVSTGAQQILVPVVADALGDLRPDFEACRALIDELGALTIYVAAVEGASARARALLVDLDRLGEDAATGSAAGPLMAYLHERLGLERLRIEQGVEMGRPSVLECSLEDGRVRVGGDVVLVMRGSVTL
ncbi:MAG TPA: PhzF family phenazine biosynthesis protein [Solirubrobacteraceae bacterium]|nr:PhzF family phenazine biosynthesis protein [Solirubrobacteraceae bacterium]